MVAAPFKVVGKFVCLGTRKPFQMPITVSDVNGEFYVFPDGLGDLTLPSDEGAVALVDLILSASGTDTSQAEIFVNGMSTGIKILNAVNLTTSISRQFAGNPVVMKPGARMKIKQLT